MKLYVTGILAAVSLALTCISSHATVGPTNFFAYNFDNSSQASIFGNWFGGDYVTNAWDSSTDSSNNAGSGSLNFEVNYNGGQYVLWDGATPSYSGLLPLAGTVRFTNLQFDIMYYYATPPLVRTNASGGVTDFGNARVGSRETSYAQDWYFYYTVPATNSLGNPNTGWTHMNIDLTTVPTVYPNLGSSGLINTMFAQDDAAYGNNILHGTQFIWYDNVQYNGWISPVPPPTMSIQKTTPGLQLFPGTGIYGRSELQITTNYLNDGWIGAGTTYPVSYSFTLNDNATSPGGLDTHLTFLPSPPDTPQGNSGADYQQANCLWLQMVSGSGANTACVCNFSWKTNATGCNPNAPVTNSLGQNQGGVALWFTNSVRAGTWTVTFSSAVAGSITAPGTNSIGVDPIPFDLTVANGATLPSGNIPAPALSSADANNNFANPMYVRFGDMNYGNGTRSLPDQWNSISVSGTAGTNFTVNFLAQSGLIDTNLWDLTSSDGGAAETIQVPTTGAPYWVKWNTPDTGWNNLETATNITGPWYSVERYNNSYADGTNNLNVLPSPLQSQHNGVEWNLMLKNYLPTADGSTNLSGALSPTALFRLTTDTNRPPL